MNGSFNENVNTNFILALQIVNSLYFFATMTVLTTAIGSQLNISNSKVSSLKEFIRQLSHEIRTPMSVVQMSLDNMSNIMSKKDCIPCLNQISNCQTCMPLFNELDECLQDSCESVDVAIGILNDCLEIDKIASGLLKCEMIPSSLGKFIRTTSKIFYGKFVSKNVVFDYSICEDDDTVNTIVNIDPPKMAQVLRNLLSNALKFTKPGGKVSMLISKYYKRNMRTCHSNSFDSSDISPKQSRVFPEVTSITSPNFVRIEVHDTGVGISEENVRKMFNESIQIDAYQNQGGGGSGFGLLISKKVIEQHNGYIGVFSHGKGKGSTFYFDLPLSHIEILDSNLLDSDSNDNDTISNRRQLINDTMPDIKHNNSLNDERQDIRDVEIVETLINIKPIALIVEDTKICSKLLSKSIVNLGVETKIVENGIMALNEIKENPDKYSIIMMDNKMPIMDGLTATEEIRRLSFDNPIIGVTGNILDDDINNFKEKGANEVLAKPVKNEEIKNVLIRYGIINGD